MTGVLLSVSVFEIAELSEVCMHWLIHNWKLWMFCILSFALSVFLVFVEVTSMPLPFFKSVA